MESRPRGPSLAVLQIVPLLMVVLFATACSGSGGANGAENDFFTSRRTNLFLRGFEDFSVNSNGNIRNPVTYWAPSVNGNLNSNFSTMSQVFYESVMAHLIINNGISATLQNISIQFTEIDGSDVKDFNTSPPTPLPGRFDYSTQPNIALVASPITSLGQPLADPALASPLSDFYIPIQLFSSGVYIFQATQAPMRPLLAKITMSGKDILNNPWRVVGYLIMSETPKSKGSDGAVDVAPTGGPEPPRFPF